MAKKDELLVVVDGNNLVIRAHGAFSRQGLTTSSGIPTGGLYGSILSHINLVKMLRPTKMVWFFDPIGGSTMRKELLPSYKGNRTREKNDDLFKQFSAFEAFLSTMDVRYYSEQGVEADDLIAGAVKNWDSEIPKVIVSADHDFHQLVSSEPRVSVLKLRQGRNSPEVLYTPKTVEDKYGVPPEKLLTIWSLCGDPSDNIPGVKGVGFLTAKKILEKYDWDLDRAILEEPKLQGQRSVIEDTKRLIELDGTEARLFVDINECDLKTTDYDSERALDFLTKWEMSSFVKKEKTGGVYR